MIRFQQVRFGARKISGRAALRGSSAGLLLLIISALAPRVAHAQTAFTVTDPTDSGATPNTFYWSPLTARGSGGTNMSDPTADQQTGQGQDDLVGTSTDPGFFIRYGQIGGVDSVAFRLMSDKLYTNGTAPGGFGGDFSIGIDTNGDGALDIVLTVVGKNSGLGINYQSPGTGADNSPSTTSLGPLTLISSFTTTNFDYEQVNSTIYPGWTTLGTGPNAVLTFAISLAQLNSALNALGKASITTSTWLGFVAFTSTQGNSINQDLYGTNSISSSTTFASSGAMSEYTDITGKPVPELPSGILTGGLLGMGLMFGWLRKHSRRVKISTE